MTDFAWTEERVGFLRELFAARCHSSSEMAELLGQRYTEAITRSAVIGKLARIGLKRGRKAGIRIAIPGAPKVPRKSPMARFRTPPTFPALEPQNSPAAPAAPSSAHQCDIMGLVNASCRYLVTAEPPHLYCGESEADVQHGIPYCGYHARICFNGKPERKSKPEYRPAGDTWMPLGAAARNVVAGLK